MVVALDPGRDQICNRLFDSIEAQVVAYDDLVAADSFAKAREAGTLRLEGKDYRFHDGDVTAFKISG